MIPSTCNINIPQETAINPSEKKEEISLSIPCYVPQRSIPEGGDQSLARESQGASPRRPRRVRCPFSLFLSLSPFSDSSFKSHSEYLRYGVSRFNISYCRCRGPHPPLYTKKKKSRLCNVSYSPFFHPRINGEIISVLTGKNFDSRSRALGNGFLIDY